MSDGQAASGAAVTGSRIRFEGTGCAGGGVHQTYSDDRNGQVVDRGGRFGHAVALHVQVAADGHIVAQHLRGTLGVRDGDCHIRVDRHAADGCRDDVGFRHGGEALCFVDVFQIAVILLALILQRRREVDRVELAVRSLEIVLLRYNADASVHGNVRLRIDDRFLLALQGGQGQRDIGGDAASRRVGDHAVGVGLAVRADVDAIRVQLPAFADDLCEVLRLVQGNTEVQGCSHAAEGACDDDGLYSGFERGFFCAGVQIDGADSDGAAGRIDDGAAFAAQIGDRHCCADRYDAAGDAGAGNQVVAVQLRAQAQGAHAVCIVADIRLVHGRDVLDFVHADHDQAVHRDEAAGDADADVFHIGLDLILDDDGSCLNGSLCACRASGCRRVRSGCGADVAPAVRPCDVRYQGYADAGKAARNGEDPDLGFGIEIAFDGDGSADVRADAVADEGVHVQSVVDDGRVHGHAGVTGYRDACRGAYHGGVARGLDVDRVSLDVCAVGDSGADLAFEGRGSCGYADCRNARAGDADHGGQHFLEVHLTLHVQFGRLLHFAGQLRLNLAGHDQGADAHGYAGHTAAADDHADHPHGGLPDRTVVVHAQLILDFVQDAVGVVVVFQSGGCRSAARGSRDRDLFVRGKRRAAGNRRADVGIQHADGQTHTYAGRAADRDRTGDHQGGQGIVGLDVDIFLCGDVDVLSDQGGRAVRQLAEAAGRLEAGVLALQAVRAGLVIVFAEVGRTGAVVLGGLGARVNRLQMIRVRAAGIPLGRFREIILVAALVDPSAVLGSVAVVHGLHRAVVLVAAADVVVIASVLRQFAAAVEVPRRAGCNGAGVLLGRRIVVVVVALLVELLIVLGVGKQFALHLGDAVGVFRRAGCVVLVASLVDPDVLIAGGIVAGLPGDRSRILDFLRFGEVVPAAVLVDRRAVRGLQPLHRRLGSGIGMVVGLVRVVLAAVAVHFRSAGEVPGHHGAGVALVHVVIVIVVAAPVQFLAVCGQHQGLLNGSSAELVGGVGRVVLPADAVQFRCLVLVGVVAGGLCNLDALVFLRFGDVIVIAVLTVQFTSVRGQVGFLHCYQLVLIAGEFFGAVLIVVMVAVLVQLQRGAIDIILLGCADIAGLALILFADVVIRRGAAGGFRVYSSAVRGDEQRLPVNLLLLVLQPDQCAARRAAGNHHAFVFSVIVVPADHVPLVAQLVIPGQITVELAFVIVVIAFPDDPDLELGGFAGRLQHAGIAYILRTAALAVSAELAVFVLGAGSGAVADNGVQLVRIGFVGVAVLVRNRVLVGLAEGALDDVDRIDAVLGMHRLAGVLVQLAAGHQHGQVHAHRCCAGAGDVHRDRVQRPLLKRLDVHGAGRRVHDGALVQIIRIVASDAGGHRVECHGHQGGHADRRRAGADQRRRHADQRVVVIRVDAHADVLAVLAVGGNLRLVFDQGPGYHLGDDQVDRAAHARRAAARGAQHVGGDDFLGVRVHTDRAAGRNSRRFPDPGVRLILEVGHDRLRGYAGRSADAHGGADVHKEFLAVRVHGDAAARVHGAAQVGLALAGEYRDVRAGAYARSAAAGQVDGQQPDIVVRVSLHSDVAGGGQVALLHLRSHFGREYQYHDGHADAGAGADSQCAGRVRQLHVVQGLHGDIADGSALSGRHRRAVRIGFDDVLGDHRIDDAAHAGGSAGYAGGDGRHNQTLLAGSADVDAPHAVCALQLVERGARGVGSQAGFVCRIGAVAVDILNQGLHCGVVYRGGDGRAGGRAAAGDGDAACRVDQHGRVIALDADMAARGRLQGVLILVVNRIVGNDHRDRAAERGAAAGTGHRHAEDHGDVLGQRLADDVPARFQGRVVRIHLHVPAEHVHVDRRADRRAGRGAGGGDDRVGEQAVGLCLDDCIFCCRFNLRAALQHDLGVGVRHQGAQGGGRGMSGAGVPGCGCDDGDQLFLIDSQHGGVLSAGQRGMLADDRLGLRFVDRHVQGTADRYLAHADGQAQGDQQQVFVGFRLHGHVAARGNLRVIADLGLRAVVRHDDVDAAADGGRALGAVAQGRRDGEQLDVGFDSRVLQIVAGRVDNRLLVAGSVQADCRPDVVVVDQHSQVEADADLGRRDAQGARDHAGIAAAQGVDFDGAVPFDLFAVPAELVRGRFLRRRDLRVADGGVNLVVEIDDCHGARDGRLGILCLRSDDGARDGFRVIVGAGQEVQQVDRFQQIFAGDFDLDGVALSVVGLLHVDHAGLGVFVRIGGFSHQGVRAPRVGEVLHGDHLLLGGHFQPVAGDFHAVADGGFHFVVAEHGGEGRADADAGALGDADAAGPDRELALVRGGNLDFLAFDLGVVMDVGGRHGVADQHGDRAGNRRLALGAADRAGQSLGRHEAAVLARGVLGQVRRDDDVAGVRFDAVDGAGHVDLRFVPVHADGDAGRDGVRILGQGHGHAGAQRAEVAFVLRQDRRAVRRVDDTAEVGGRLMLADRQADRRGNLHLLGILLRVAAQAVLTGGALCLADTGFLAFVAGSGVLLGSLGLQDAGGNRRVVVSLVLVRVA